jgi:hypothetical protein
MNIADTAISGISPKNVPSSARWTEMPAAGAMSPEPPVTVSAPPLWLSVPGCPTPFGPVPPTLVAVQSHCIRTPLDPVAIIAA